jgi:hypothetical protein
MLLPKVKSGVSRTGVVGFFFLVFLGDKDEVRLVLPTSSVESSSSVEANKVEEVVSVVLLCPPPPPGPALRILLFRPPPETLFFLPPGADFGFAPVVELSSTIAPRRRELTPLFVGEEVLAIDITLLFLSLLIALAVEDLRKMLPFLWGEMLLFL